MESVFILSGETGEVLVEHDTPGSRTGPDVIEDFWVELNKDQRIAESVPSVLAMPQCYFFHVRSDPLIFACTTQREVGKQKETD